MTIEFIEGLKYQWMAMIDAISDPLALLDDDYSILRQNKAYTDLAAASDLDIRHFKGHKCYESFAGQKSPCKHCKLGALKSSSSGQNFVTWETSTLFSDKVFSVRVHKVLQGDSFFFVVHYRDETAQKIMQEQLAQADKLAALGKMAGGVAHEINSPLAGILAFSQMVLKEMDADDPHRDDLKEIEDGARKCKVIVEGMLGFSRQEKPSEMQPTDVFEAARSTLRLASAILRKHHIDLQSEFVPESAVVFGSQGKLGQVFLNLVTNAIYVMREGGVLTLEGKVTETDAVVTVSDTGPGIEPAVVGKIFDPFFTTKPIGEGTGLGLSIVYSIVKQHAGKIEVQSLAGLGSTFTVTIPLYKEGARD